MGRTALVVLVPEAEPVVAELRALHDPMARRGVPAHITVLHPFRRDPDAAAFAAVGAVCAATEPFAATLDAVGRFDGGVVFLRPAPTAIFAGMTLAMAARFPDCPPYGGQFAEPVPHLTVTQSATPSTVDEVAGVLARSLPIAFRVTELALLAEDGSGHWQRSRSWPLGVPRSG